MKHEQPKNRSIKNSNYFWGRNFLRKHYSKSALKLSYALRFIAVFSCAILSSGLFAGSTPPFQDGDVICFLGDSITHGGRYPFYILEYYATRYPERKLVIHNCGISGDSAAGSWNRLQWDLIDRRPNKTTIMLGMNDVGRGYYGIRHPDKNNLKARRNCIDRYKTNMIKIGDELKEKGISIIYITPSPYDQTVTNERKNLFGVNDALAECGVFCREQAVKNKASLVDFNRPMTEINVKKQKADPGFSLVGTDRIHPHGTGHFVMAYLFLKSQNMPALVSAVRLDYENAKLLAEDNCHVSSIEKTGNSFSFDCLEKALPMPVTDEYRAADKIVNLTKDLNNEIVSFSSLPRGEYELYIDGEKVVKADAKKWAIGVNIAVLATPMQKQAAAVHALVDKKRRAESTLRNLCQMEISMRKAHVDINDPEARKKYFDNFLKKIQKLEYAKYYTYLVESYRSNKSKEKGLQEKVNNMNKEIYRQNTPKIHHFELKTKLFCRKH